MPKVAPGYPGHVFKFELVALVQANSNPTVTPGQAKSAVKAHMKAIGALDPKMQTWIHGNVSKGIKRVQKDAYTGVDWRPISTSLLQSPSEGFRDVGENMRARFEDTAPASGNAPVDSSLPSQSPGQLKFQWHNAVLAGPAAAQPPSSALPAPPPAARVAPVEALPVATLPSRAAAAQGGGSSSTDAGCTSQSEKRQKTTHGPA